jgi:fructokinase
MRLAPWCRAGASRHRLATTTPRCERWARWSMAERELASRGTVGVGMPGAPRSRGWSRQNAQLDLAQRSRAQARPEGRLARPCASRTTPTVSRSRSHRWRSARRGGGLRRDPRHRGWRWAGGVAARVLTGPNAIAGEWGHNPLPAPEPADQPLPQCYCGRRGCVETFLWPRARGRSRRAASGLLRDDRGARSASG